MDRCRKQKSTIQNLRTLLNSQEQETAALKREVGDLKQQLHASRAESQRHLQRANTAEGRARAAEASNAQLRASNYDKDRQIQHLTQLVRTANYRHLNTQNEVDRLHREAVRGAMRRGVAQRAQDTFQSMTSMAAAAFMNIAVPSNVPEGMAM